MSYPRDGGGGDGPASPWGHGDLAAFWGQANTPFSVPLTGEGLRVPGCVLEHQQRGHRRHHHACARGAQHSWVGAEGRVRWVGEQWMHGAG